MNMMTPMNCVKSIRGVKKDHTGQSAMLKLQRKEDYTVKWAPDDTFTTKVQEGHCWWTIVFCPLPARGSNKSCSGDGGNGGVLVVIVLDAFEPFQINNAKHGQRETDPKE